MGPFPSTSARHTEEDVPMDTEQWTTSRLHEHHQNQRLVDIGVTQAGATTLKALSDSGPVSQAGLALLVHVQAQTMGKVLEKLELKKLVSRARDSWDGRTLRTQITPQGRTVLQRIDRMNEDSAESTRLPTQELRQALIAIINGLEPARI
jgi:DNA-binding MarR family transcriptional regulator